MHRVVPVLAVAAVLAGCPFEGPGPGSPLTVSRITPESPAPSSTSGLHDPLHLAVFDATTFAELWARAYSGRSPQPTPPPVDFAQQFVIVAALGEHSTGGYGIEVVRAAARGGHVQVEIVTTAPGKGCMVTAAMTQPLDVVRLERPRAGDLDVDFGESLQVRDCQ